ncbi:hypothetical protein ACVJGD_005439 [Bradyrhizobium sp. USDA 10063]
MDHEGLDAMSPQPVRQPKTIAIGFKGDRHAVTPLHANRLHQLVD